MADRRPSRRRRMLLGGRVAFDDGAQVFDCTIRDLSEGGARFTVPAGRNLPHSVYVLNIRDRLVYQCTVVWRRGGEAGVQFEKTYKLGELGEAKLGYMLDLWLERAQR